MPSETLDNPPPSTGEPGDAIAERRAAAKEKKCLLFRERKCTAPSTTQQLA